MSTAIIILFSGNAAAQYSRGKVLEGLTIKSGILKKDVRFTVYLPFDYDTSQRYYPVVYLLHGYSDNDMGWMQFGEANMLADKAIAENEIPPMILIMPDAGVSFYINNYDGSVSYEDFFFKEFMPYVESKFRIRAEKRYRGVSGLSMGGYGTLVYALKHPDMFAACAAFSAALNPDEDILKVDESRWNNLYGVLYGPDLKGEARLTDHFKANNPLDFVTTMDRKSLFGLRIYIDCGDDDFLYKGNSLFHILLRDLQVPHEYRVRNGGHTWTYWRTGLIDALKFMGDSFHQF